MDKKESDKIVEAFISTSPDEEMLTPAVNFLDSIIPTIPKLKKVLEILLLNQKLLRESQMGLFDTDQLIKLYRKWRKELKNGANN